MARFLKMQNEIEIEITDDGHLLITENSIIYDSKSILIKSDYIELFVNELNLAIKDGYQGD